MSSIIRSCCSIICCLSVCRLSEINDREEAEIEDQSSNAEEAETKNETSNASSKVVIKSPSTKLQKDENVAIVKGSGDDTQVSASTMPPSVCNSRFEIETKIEESLSKSFDENREVSDKSHNSHGDESSDFESLDLSDSNPKSIEHKPFEESSSNFTSSKEYLTVMMYDGNEVSNITDKKEYKYQPKAEVETDVSSENDSSSNSSSSNQNSSDHELSAEYLPDFATLKESVSDISCSDSATPKVSEVEHEQNFNENPGIIANEIKFKADDKTASTTSKIHEESDKQNQQSNFEPQEFQEDSLPEFVNTDPSTNDLTTTDENDKDFSDVFATYSDVVDFKIEIDDGNSSTVSDETITNPDEEPLNTGLDIIDMLMNETENVSQTANTSFELKRYMEGRDVWQAVSHDAFVIVEDKTFKCHKEILSSQSQIFKDSFGGQSNIQILWRMNPILASAESLHAILTFLYTGQMRVKCNQIRDIYNASKRLQFNSATEKCLELINTSSQQLKSFVNLYAFSYELENLQHSKAFALKTLALNFETMVFESDYLDLNVDQIVELFSQNEIDTRSEVVVFIAALKWIDHDFLEREEHTVPVLSTVRFEQMTTDELLTCHIPPLLPGLVKMQEVKELMHDALCYIVAQNLGIENSFKSVHSKPRTLLKKGLPLNLWSLSAFDDYVIEKAAIEIQAAFRSYSARKRMAESGSEETRNWLQNRKARQEYRRRVDQLMQDRTSNTCSMIKTSNRHYERILKELFQRKKICAESLE